MVEINFGNPLAMTVRSCRRIVSDGTPILDKSWRDKITDERQMWRGSGGYVISRSSAQVPKGMKVEFELDPGSDMSGWVYGMAGRIVVDERALVPVHVCTREMARCLGHDRGWDGVVKGGQAEGMKYVFVKREDLEDVMKKIQNFLDSSKVNNK